MAQYVTTGLTKPTRTENSDRNSVFMFLSSLFNGGVEQGSVWFLHHIRERERDCNDGSSRNRVRADSARTVSLPLRFRYFQKALPDSHRSLQVRESLRSHSHLNTNAMPFKIVIHTSLRQPLPFHFFSDLFYQLVISNCFAVQVRVF